MTLPSWFERPATGVEGVDACHVAMAVESLDAVSSGHRTDAFRILAMRYREDLIRMQREDAARAVEGVAR